MVRGSHVVAMAIGERSMIYYAGTGEFIHSIGIGKQLSCIGAVELSTPLFLFFLKDNTLTNW